MGNCLSAPSGGVSYAKVRQGLACSCERSQGVPPGGALRPAGAGACCRSLRRPAGSPAPHAAQVHVTCRRNAALKDSGAGRGGEVPTSTFPAPSARSHRAGVHVGALYILGARLRATYSMPGYPAPAALRPALHTPTWSPC